MVRRTALSYIWCINIKIWLSESVVTLCTKDKVKNFLRKINKSFCLYCRTNWRYTDFQYAVMYVCMHAYSWCYIICPIWDLGNWCYGSSYFGGYQYHNNIPPNSDAAGALDRPQRNAPTGNRVDSLNTSSLPYIEVMRGRDRRDGWDGVSGPCGPQGQKGDTGAIGPWGPPGPRSGGVVYTRWGKASCPSVSGQKQTNST